MPESESVISVPHSKCGVRVYVDRTNNMESLEGGSLELQSLARTKVYHESDLKKKS